MTELDILREIALNAKMNQPTLVSTPLNYIADLAALNWCIASCETSLACHLITESRPLKNVARENANKLQKKKRACVTSRRPVNRTVNHVIPCVRRVHKYCFLLRQPKRSAIHRRIDVISRVILIKLYCLKIGQMKNQITFKCRFIISVKMEYV